MIKLLAIDQTGLDTLDGFTRQLQRPRKHRAGPLLVADRPWEHGNMQLYGSVIRPAGGPFQLWYSTIRKPFKPQLAYATSDDGIHWVRAKLKTHLFRGRPTNLVLEDDIHGPAVILDERDPDPQRRYKLVGGSASSSGCIRIYTSPDGIAWSALQRDPQIPHMPDSPMAFLRLSSGRYACHHRALPWQRRICRSESWDLVNWDEPRLILDPGPSDPPRRQFYGMGSACYGPFELGTLWVFHIDDKPMDRTKMNGHQEAELTFCRSGHAWHRVAPGEAFIPHGQPGQWDGGNLQCASQPVYLDDEIRYYFVGCNIKHGMHWELNRHVAGLSYASLKPDRFCAFVAGIKTAQIITRPVLLPEGGTVRLNARTHRRGAVRAALLRIDGTPLPGFGLKDSIPFSGDAIDHPLRWKKHDTIPALTERVARLQLEATHADIFSFFTLKQDESAVYHQFREWK